MRRFCLMLLAGLYVFVMQAQVPEIYGLLRYSETDFQQYGLMQVNPESETATQMVWQDTDMVLTGTGGAVFVEGTYYVLSFMDFGGMLAATYVAADPETKTYRSVGDEVLLIDFSYIASDMTYDVTTGKVFAVSLNGSGDGTFVLSTMDLESGMKTPIAPIRQMCALSADDKGHLYAIDMEGQLYLVDKSTADLTMVGATGVVPAADCSATFDPATGLLYWSAYTAAGGALYQVDVNTGKATQLCTYPNGEQITGIFIKEPEKQLGTPSPIEYALVEFDGPSLDGRIRFELPLSDVDGNGLSDALNWNVMLANEVLSEGQGMPGEEVSLDVSVPVDGMYRFALNVSNVAGNADPCYLNRYVGWDTPKKPENVTFTTHNGEVQLTWDIAESGINEGYVDVSSMTHQIVRLPDGVVVAEEHRGNRFTEVLPLDGIRAYYYQVKPKMSDYVGEFEYSNVDTVGNHMAVPFKEDFTDVMRYILYTSVDVNGDECYWTWTTLPEDADHQPCATYMWGIAETNDDWLVSPPVLLESGKEYHAICSVRGEADEYAGNLEMALGAAPDPASLSRCLLQETRVDFAKDSLLTTGTFTVDESGIYHLGLHVTGKRSHFYIYLHSLELVEATTGVASVQGESVRVMVSNGRLQVNAAAPQKIEVVALSGRMVYAGVTDRLSLSLPQGVYVVKSGDNTQKVVVR